MLKKIILAALCVPLLAFGQSYPSPTFNNVTSQGTATLNNAIVSGTFTATGNIGLASLAAQAANTVLANATASSASPTAFAMPSCSTSASALNWTSGTGFGCNSALATSGANANITSLTGLTTPLSIAQGGTGSGTQAGALSNILGSSTVPVANGGTARASLTSHAVLVGAGTSAITQVAPSTAGQALISAGASADPVWGYPTGTLIGVQRFTSSGTYTATTGTNSVIVEVQAAGGGSGGTAATGAGQTSASTGSGSGAYARVRFTSGFSGVTVTIGAAGTAGSAGGVGGDAAATTFGSLISCPGGHGSGAGFASSTGGGMVSGAAPTSAPTISGGTTLLSVAGTGTAPSFLLSAAQSFSPPGASSMLGQGGAQTQTIGTAGVPGTGYGSGAASAINGNSQSAQVGVAGSPAIVLVYEYN